MGTPIAALLDGRLVTNHHWTAGYKPWMGSWLQILDGQLVTNPRWAAGYKPWMGSWLQTLDGQLVTNHRCAAGYKSSLCSWLQTLDGQLVTNHRCAAGYKSSLCSWLQTIAALLRVAMYILRICRLRWEVCVCACTFIFFITQSYKAGSSQVKSVNSMSQVKSMSSSFSTRVASSPPCTHTGWALIAALTQPLK